MCFLSATFLRLVSRLRAKSREVTLSECGFYLCSVTPSLSFRKAIHTSSSNSHFARLRETQAITLSGAGMFSFMIVVFSTVAATTEAVRATFPTFAPEKPRNELSGVPKSSSYAISLLRVNRRYVPVPSGTRKMYHRYRTEVFARHDCGGAFSPAFCPQ
jgi:hypothetical protein